MKNQGKTEKVLPATSCMNLACVLTVCGVLFSLSYYICFLKGDIRAVFLCFVGVAICDAIDGKVARKLNQTSEFGLELDSLCDFGSFVIFPTLVFLNVGNYSPGFLLAGMVFVMNGVLRLAYFNTREADGCFVGISAPLAATLLLAYYYVSFHMFPNHDMTMAQNIYPIIAIVIAFCMVLGFKIRKYGFISFLIASFGGVCFVHCMLTSGIAG